MTTQHDDPLLALESDARRLVGLLEVGASSEARDLAAKLERALGRVARALSSRRTEQSRAAVVEAESRVSVAELEETRAVQGRRIADLEEEVEALLATSPSAAQALYDARARALADAVDNAKTRREELEAQIHVPGEEGGSEMEISRRASRAGRARDEERELVALLSRVREKLERAGRLR